MKKGTIQWVALAGGTIGAIAAAIAVIWGLSPSALPPATSKVVYMQPAPKTQLERFIDSSCGDRAHTAGGSDLSDAAKLRWGLFAGGNNGVACIMVEERLTNPVSVIRVRQLGSTMAQKHAEYRGSITLVYPDGEQRKAHIWVVSLKSLGLIDETPQSDKTLSQYAVAAIPDLTE